MNKDHEDYFIRGLKRATERRAKQPSTPASKSTRNEPVVSEPVLAKPLAIKPEFNLEAYRLDIIAKAIAHILKQQKGI